MSKVKHEDIEFTGGYNLLMLKAEEGNIEEVHRILTESKNVDINAGNKKGYTALALAIKSGNIELVKLLLSAGADPNRKNNSGQTSLFLACWHNFEIVVRLLLDCGADLNSVDHRGWTPLMISAYHGHRQIVKELLARKADTSAQDLFGKKAIDRAKDSEVIRLLTNTSNKMASPQRKPKDNGSFYSPSSAQKSFNQPSSILKKSSSKVSIGHAKTDQNQSLLSPNSTAISIQKSPSLHNTQRRSTEPRQNEPRRNSGQYKFNSTGGFNTGITVSTSHSQSQKLQAPQSAEKSTTAVLKNTLNEIISPIKAATSVRIASSPSQTFERQLFKEDMEKFVIDQMGIMCHKMQQLVERKAALEIPMQMQTYEFQFKKEVESLLKFKAADIFKNLQAIFNLKLKFCLTRLGYDTAGLGLAPFLEDEAPYVPEAIAFAKEPTKLYNEKEYKAIENDIDRIEKSILNNKIPNSGRGNHGDCSSPAGHQCDHTSQVHRTEVRNDLLDVLGNEVRATTEYLLEYSNGKVGDMTREESGFLFKKIMTEVTDSMEVLEDELKFKFEQIINDKLNKVTEALGSAAGNEIPQDRFKTVEAKTPIQAGKYNKFLNTTEDKLKAQYLESTAAALKDEKYTSDFSQDPMRDSMYSEKKGNESRARAQDALQTKDRIQRIKNSLNFMDDSDDYDPRTDKLNQQSRNVQNNNRRVEQEREEYVDEEEEEEEEEIEEEPPVPERIDEEAEIEKAYDPTYRSSLTTETLYQTSSRDYKSVGSNRNNNTNTSFRNNAKLQQPYQSRGTHDAKNSAKKVQIPGHKFQMNDNRRVEVEAVSSKYYNFANE